MKDPLHQQILFVFRFLWQLVQRIQNGIGFARQNLLIPPFCLVNRKILLTVFFRRYPFGNDLVRATAVSVIFLYSKYKHVLFHYKDSECRSISP